jgi:cytochrome c oxidase cbb3-type subunit 3
MAVEERDPHTGYLTTGHNWNGIKELNTPVPRPVWFFLITTALFAIGYWILMPAWPTGISYTKGLLGIDQRNIVAESLKNAALERSVWTKRIESESYAQIQADPRLMQAVRQTGHTLFADNCAVCHGSKATGGKGYPNLTTNSWLHGGTPEQIFETIRVGINSAHPDTRVAEMPAFGRSQMLPRADIEKVARYVQALSDPAARQKLGAEQFEAGHKIFATGCASCHGEDAKGQIETGAPNLTDPFWIYGGSLSAIYDTLWDGRKGHMPTWEGRLSALDRKILALYLVDLRGKKQ